MGAGGRGISSMEAVEAWRQALVEGLTIYLSGRGTDAAWTPLEDLNASMARNLSWGDLDAAVVQVGRGIIDSDSEYSSAPSSAAPSPPPQLVHYSLREKGRRLRALVMLLLDTGLWGAVSAGRGVLAEFGEMTAAAERLCELQDTLPASSVGQMTVRLLEECMRVALKTRGDDAPGEYSGLSLGAGA
ncbi:unnamed protein product, partial [Discosporangium mesarthrocarpum]